MKKSSIVLGFAVCGLIGATLALAVVVFRAPDEGKVDPSLLASFAAARLRSAKNEEGAIQEARFEREQAGPNKRILAALPLVSLGKPRLVKRWNSLPTAFRLQFSPDGAYLAVGGGIEGGEGGIDLRSTRDWKSQGRFPGSCEMAWSPDSRLLALENIGVDVYNVRRKELLFTLSDGTGIDKSGAGVYAPLLFSADSSKLATLGEDPQSTWKRDENTGTDATYARQIALKIWDASNGKRLLVKPGPSSGGGNQLVRFANNPQRTEFASVAKAPYMVSNTHPPIYVFESRNPPQLFDFQVHPDRPFATVAIRTRDYIAAIAGNGWIYGAFGDKNSGLFRTRDQKLLAALPASKTGIMALALSLDAKILAIAERHEITKTFPDGSTRDLCRSQISIYRLSPTVK